MIPISTLYNRAASWNAKRYERVFNIDLTIDLLLEEFNEYYEAKSIIGHVDACCDLVFVALGATWKLDADEDVLNKAAQLASHYLERFMQSSEEEPMKYAREALAHYIRRIRVDKVQPDVLASVILTQIVIVAALNQLSQLGLTDADIYKAVKIVCDSNDSKSIKKVESDAKYSDEGKGTYYIDPQPKLQALINEVIARVH